MNEMRKISEEELGRILAEHEKWVESEGIWGKMADLRWADLRETKLQYANLLGANLRKTNLQYANLWGANLVYANLQEADLRKANLVYAILQKTDLRGVNLQGADLQDITPHGATFQGADLRNTEILNSDFENANLLNVKVNRENFRYLPFEYVFSAREKDGYLILGANDENIITRCIEFPPEYHQAGIAILNYFGEVLRRKYPDMNAKIRIEQDGLKVTMIIETPDGEKETVERALNEYGLVVTGKMAPEEYFFESKLDAMRLRHKLQMAEMEVRQTKEILTMERENHAGRIERLEDDIQWFKNYIGGILKHSENLAKKDSSTNTTYISGRKIEALEIQSVVQADNINHLNQKCEEMGDTINAGRDVNKAGRDMNTATGSGSTATMNKSCQGIDAKAVLGFLSQLKKHVDDLELEIERKGELSKQVVLVESELERPNPEPARVNEYLVSIRNILDGIAGSIIASGLLYEMAKLIG